MNDHIFTFAAPPEPHIWQKREISIRVIDPAKDEYLLRRAFNWQTDKPTWWRTSMAVWKAGVTLDKYLEYAHHDAQIDIGIFGDDYDFTGLITLAETDEKNVFESHIDAPRTARLDELVEGVEIARDFAFQSGTKAIYNYVARMNRPILKLCRKVGFRETNARVIYGAIGNKVIEWKEFVLTPDFSKQTY